MAARGMIVINEELCKGVPDCGNCVRRCPFTKKFNLITMSTVPNSKGKFFAVFSDPQNLCKGCALCFEVCPEIGNCINVLKEVLE